MPKVSDFLVRFVVVVLFLLRKSTPYAFSDDLPGLCQEARSTSYGMSSEQRLAQRRRKQVGIVIIIVICTPE